MKRLIGLLVLAFIANAGQVYAQEKGYKVGDRGPANGFVFFDKGYISDGWRYMEAAPGDEVEDSVWSNVHEVLGTTKTGVGTGKVNTKAIIDQTGQNESVATLCNKLDVVYNGKSFKGWFLPSIDELNLMYNNLASKGEGNFRHFFYWSSSEADEINVWGQFFSDGDQLYGLKFYIANVRCVRAF